jgi:hypothetical protein
VAAIIPKMEMVVPITDKVFIFVGRKSPIPRLQLKKVLKISVSSFNMKSRSSL